MKIVIINCGVGNVGSVKNMLKKIGHESVISAEISDIEKADKLIFPGIGAFDSGMERIEQLGILPVLEKKVIENKTPILGICLGMQLFGKSSEEGKKSGLGLVDANTIRFRFDDTQTKLKIPHMGWNTTKAVKKNPLFLDLEDDARFYFVHSYHVVCNKKEDVIATTNYGSDFVSSLCKENIFGVQFHPEKSHKYGMRLLKNFVEVV
ncbi:MAG: imidazole glycerol phosphate synthase subunit HisH [Candidatus Aenigmarchaeota archaeon]|nr:imidazole glycerol phosphate synthase subunit HisH [Candidatus Aenigmarchaeota archaeon]